VSVKEALKIAVDIFGTEKNLAGQLGVRPPTVNQWLSGVRPVPPKRAIQIEAITHGSSKKEDLCPNFPWEGITAKKAS